jgi:hypothetical protein
MDPRVKLISTVRCPKCGFESPEQMPERYCLVRYECRMCGHIMVPGEGKCCIFCTFGDVKCPSMQEIDLKLADEMAPKPQAGQ